MNRRRCPARWEPTNATRWEGLTDFQTKAHRSGDHSDAPSCALAIDSFICRSNSTIWANHALNADWAASGPNDEPRFFATHPPFSWTIVRFITPGWAGWFGLVK